MSCNLHQEGLELSACTSPTLRKLSGGQPWCEVPPWRDKMVSVTEQIDLVGQGLCWEKVGVAMALQAWVGEVVGGSWAHLTHCWLLGRLPGQSKWRKGTEAKS